ncbi:MAG TPA: hypothetical protein VNU68_07635 [Verrucomicrobiae bacterium]|nr:hypothetical protein [Verrucomicrobiae bacterium]
MNHTLPLLLASVVMAGGQEYSWVNFAGSLLANGDADGGPGTSLFSQLYGVDCDSADNVWVADRGTGKIKRITPGGMVTTVLGGFVGLTQIAVNRANGNVYAVDLEGAAIKKLEPPLYARAITIDSGYSAIGLGVDSSIDAVYVGDLTHQTIRQISSDGVVTTVAGSGSPALVDGDLFSASFNNPCGIAVDGLGNLYVADRENNAIRYVNFTANLVITLAGGGSAGCDDGLGSVARFRALTGVAIGPDGNIFVADQDNFTIRKMTPDGDVTTIGGACLAGGATEGVGSASLNGNIAQVAVDSAGNLYTADRDLAPGSHARVNKGSLPGAPTAPRITRISLPPSPGSVEIDFIGGPGDNTGSFAVQSAEAITGTYSDVSATITQIGPASFRAVIGQRGGSAFFRIKRQ